MLSLIKIKDIHQREDADHVYAIVRTGPRVIYVVRAGDLVPTGAMLVTLGLEWKKMFLLKDMCWIITI